MTDPDVRSESDEFIGYKKISGYIVAEFRSLCHFFDEDGQVHTFVLNKSSCESRLKNLQMGGYPHNQTSIALERWPVIDPGTLGEE